MQSFSWPIRQLLRGLPPFLAPGALFIFEFGITNNNAGCAAGPWVESALGDLLGGRWPDVRGFAWWNERWNNDGAEGSDMLVQDDPAIAAAFRAALNGASAPLVVDQPVFK